MRIEYKIWLAADDLTAKAQDEIKKELNLSCLENMEKVLIIMIDRDMIEVLKGRENKDEKKIRKCYSEWDGFPFPAEGTQRNFLHAKSCLFL